MTLTELRNNGLYPTHSQCKAIEEYYGSDESCPYGDFLDCYYFCDNSNAYDRFAQCGIIRNKTGYHLVTYNCALIKRHYPIDTWQIDVSANSVKDKQLVVHYFHCLVLSLLKDRMHFTTEELIEKFENV